MVIRGNFRLPTTDALHRRIPSNHSDRVQGEWLESVGRQATPKLTINKFSEWRQAHEEQAFKNPEAFVSSGLLVGVLSGLGYHKCMSSRLELQGFQKEIDANSKPSVQDMQT